MKHKEKDDNFQTIREQFKDRTPEELDLEFEDLKKELNVKEKFILEMENVNQKKHEKNVNNQKNKR